MQKRLSLNCFGAYFPIHEVVIALLSPYMDRPLPQAGLRTVVSHSSTHKKKVALSITVGRHNYAFVNYKYNYMQWRTQDFRMGGVEVMQAPRGVGCGEGVFPSSLGEGSGEGAVPRKFFVFLLKIPYFDAF